MMGTMRIPTVWLAVCLGPLLSVAMLLTSCSRPADHASAVRAPGSRTSGSAQQLSQPGLGQVAGPVNPDPRVGAFFFDGLRLHSCTGSVVHSKGGNLVLTAAHCLSGGSPATFVPGFAGHAAPVDLWTVDTVYFDPRWLATKDPSADYVIARVSGTGTVSLESHVGSALVLGTAPAPGSRVKLIGYPAGVGGLPIGCQASTGITDRGFPSLACEGMVNGTSGAPWVSGTAVVGLIGGLDGGGCAEDMSYSAPFDEHTAQLLARAEAGGPGDHVPSDYEDAC
jgi:hypothetical protein